ncbi:hypothetical protein [Intestinibacter bartlettii]|uniref:hypothetical protein n=1 Tax=Intestinibacter bartlettii TaxID=261299 RepID=UPI0006648E8C|nr:hypothetical protein [Intestinibacter bartlettii]KMW26246.1 hypothetical protein HMPREF0977_00769 [Clostridium sp. 1_1_41A1FAA]MDU5919937.1 hypothetical protein [Clostridiales bacterium]MCC2705749.1 hypothetical protein [Intestinibacter bartlettii]MCC2761199.1 hypothetical protein [Intestinibacter bartlettii]MDU6472156.1 hypothetical protein [Intestinibacter bartlettii]
MKKYIVQIASRDIDLSRIKFSEPLSCEIDNNKINITYKKHLDSNTYKTVKNKTGVNFKGEIVKNKDTIDLVGDFHCSTQFKILYITAAILVALCACYIALSDFVKVWVVMAEILISLFVYIHLVAEGYYDLDELYKEVDTSLKVQKKNKIKKSLCYILSITMFLSGVIGVIIFGIGSQTKQFEIVNEYSPLYEKHHIAVDEDDRLYVVCENYTEIFDKEGNFLMKVNHGRGVTSVYLNFRDGLTSFLLHGKGKEYEEPNYYHEFVVDISNKKILNKNTYKEAQIEIENPNRSRYYMKEDTLYTIRDDKVYIEGDGVDKVLDLNSPKSPIFFGYFFILAAMGVSLLFFTRLRYR